MDTHVGHKTTFWARGLAVCVLMFATPGVGEVVQEVVSVAVGAECCDGPCDEGAGQSCPNTCAHCVCCVHPRVIPAAPLLMPGGPGPHELTFAWYSDDAYASGYRAPPFRPPVA